MSSRTGGDTRAIAEVATVLAGVARRVDDAGTDAGAAVSRFVDRSSELVPALPDHRRRLEALAARVETLGVGVGRVATELADADRLRGRWWLPSPGASLSWATTGASAVGAGETLASVSRHGYAAGRVAVLDARWGDGSTIAMARYRAVTNNPVGVANNRTLSPLKHSQELTNATARATATSADDALREVLRQQSLKGMAVDTAADVAALRGAGPVGAAFREASGVTGRAAAVVRHPRIAFVGSVGRRALGPIGVGLNIVGAGDAYAAGDTERAITQGAQAVGGAMMLSGFPPAQVLGAAVTVGAIVYENREAIGRAASRLADGGGQLLAAAGGVLKGLF